MENCFTPGKNLIHGMGGGVTLKDEPVSSAYENDTAAMRKVTMNKISLPMFPP
jgi:hypothetical protein